MKPYEEDRSRIRAMYRLAAASPHSRILELSVDSQPLLDGDCSAAGFTVTCLLRRPPAAPPAPRQCICIADYRRPLPFAPNSFDLVFMHDGLDHLLAVEPWWKRRPAAVDLVSRIGTVLVSGGVFAASVTNRSLISRWKRRIFAGKSDTASASTLFSIRTSRDILEACGFAGVQVFNVVPSHRSPLRLINTDADLARLAFRCELEQVRPYLATPEHLLRRVVVELGLARLLEDSLLFWGHKR
jgi:SAM-dependent methyltransferase